MLEIDLSGGDGNVFLRKEHLFMETENSCADLDFRKTLSLSYALCGRPSVGIIC